MSTSRPFALISMDPRLFEAVYDPQTQKRMAERAQLVMPHCVEPSALGSVDLSQVQVLFTSWGSPRLDAALLAKMPELKLALYGAGSVKGLVGEGFWDRSVRLSSAWRANALPVIEFTFALIVLGLKRFPALVSSTREKRTFDRPDVRGMYGATIGIVSLGAIGRGLAEMLSRHEVRVLAADPFISHDVAERLGVELISIEEVFERSDVVSIHTPLLPETRGTIGASFFERMKQDSVFINTSRGGVLVESDLVRFAESRPDVQVYLDVTDPEPPEPNSALYDLPNVYLTPHVAGSVGAERARMGSWMLDEFERWLKGEPLQHEVDEKFFRIMA